jgi:O-antigen/teichoic acid export membrane protein
MSKNITSKQKQFFWYNFANYCGFFLVLISIGYLYEINIEIVGKIKYVESIALALVPFLSLGLSQAFVHFSPIIENYHAKTLYGNSLVLIFFTSIVVVIVLNIVHFFYEINNFSYIIFGTIISFTLSFLEIIKSCSLTIDKVIVPVLVEKIAPKVFLIIILLVFGKLTHDNNTFLPYYSGMYIIVILYLFSYLNKFFKPRFSTKTEYLFENIKKKDLYKYMFFSVLSSSLAFLAFKIEGLIVPHFFSMKTNGLFGISLLLASSVGLPGAGIIALNSPMVSTMIKNSNFKNLNIKYKEVAKLIFYKSYVILSILICVLPMIFSYIYVNNNDFLDLIPIIEVLSIGYLINGATGFNNEIIIYSKFHRYTYIFTTLLVLINLGLMYYFLYFTDFGILGVAYSITISMIVFNFMKLCFIKLKFNLIPFDLKYFKLVFLMTIVLLSAYFLPSANNILIDVLLRVAIIFGLNVLIVRRLKLIDRSEIL